MKPFSTYPEDREKLLALARRIDAEPLHDEFDAHWEFVRTAYQLADLVKAILEDEQLAIRNKF